MSKLPYTRVHVELSGAPGGWEGEFTVMPLVSTFLEGIASPDQPYFCFFQSKLSIPILGWTLLLLLG